MFLLSLSVSPQIVAGFQSCNPCSHSQLSPLNSSMAFVPAAADSMFRNHEDDHFPTSPPCPPQDFQGVSELLMRRSVQFSGMDPGKELQHDDDTSEDGSHMLGEKKRRLNLEQVRALEKSFELGNKLEPERKMQLARALGLQPRQIAIWFQNRRARWKTKQLEKGYDVLKKQFEALKADNDALKSQNKKLQTQLMALKTRESGRINLNKENEGSWSNGSENSCEVNLNKTSTDSTLYPPIPNHQTNENAPVMFPAPAPAGIMHLLHGSSNSRPGNNHPAPLSNAGFCNMFPGIEENPDFWSWSEHQTFH